jgi:hypothetical protein
MTTHIHPESSTAPVPALGRVNSREPSPALGFKEERFRYARD